MDSFAFRVPVAAMCARSLLVPGTVFLVLPDLVPVPGVRSPRFPRSGDYRPPTPLKRLFSFLLTGSVMLLLRAKDEEAG
jgi:hypothetical protein